MLTKELLSTSDAHHRSCRKAARAAITRSLGSVREASRKPPPPSPGGAFDRTLYSGIDGIEIGDRTPCNSAHGRRYNLGGTVLRQFRLKPVESSRASSD